MIVVGMKLGAQMPRENSTLLCNEMDELSFYAPRGPTVSVESRDLLILEIEGVELKKLCCS